MTGSPPWHEDEEFWAAFHRFVFPPETIDAAPEQVEKLLALLDPDPDARVLDLPCGVGRHTVELARRGFDVTSVDATELYLDTARDRWRSTDVQGDGSGANEGTDATVGDVEFELTDLLDRIGFGDVTVYGNFDGEDYDEAAERLVVVARK